MPHCCTAKRLKLAHSKPGKTYALSLTFQRDRSSWLGKSCSGSRERYIAVLQPAWKLPLSSQLGHSGQTGVSFDLADEAPWAYFDSRKKAEAFLRSAENVTRNNDNTQKTNIDSFSRVHAFDYPIMFFLQKLAKEGKLETVTDLAAHLGLKYTSYRKYIDFQDDFVWQIAGGPALHGDDQHLNLTNRSSMRFFDNVEDTEPCSALICSGILPYLGLSLEQMICSLPERPPVILLNEISISQKAGFYLLAPFGTRQTLHKVMTLPEVEQVRRNLGYTSITRWGIPERPFTFGALKGDHTSQMVGEAWCL